jgi:hypothetical protein
MTPNGEKLLDHLTDVYGFSFPAHTMSSTELFQRLFVAGLTKRADYRHSPVAQLAQYMLQQLKGPLVKVTVRDIDHFDETARRFQRGCPVEIKFEDADDPTRPGIVFNTYLGANKISDVYFPIGGTGNWTYDEWAKSIESLERL